MPVDLNHVAVFLAVAEAKSFTTAARNLGVTRSAISQTIRRMENRLGIALVQRTSRSVSLTEAGEALYRRVAPAVSEVGLALEATRDRDAAPSGLLRVAVSSIAERFISGPLLASFVESYPSIQLDITITDEEFDIVSERYDAGVRLGEVIEQDMVAVPVSAKQRQLVVGAPSYLARTRPPKHPTDLTQHRCIGWRPSPRAEPYRWEFEEDGREFDVAVNPQVATNDMWVMLRTAVAGGGLTFGMEETFRPYIQRGELVPLLQRFCPQFAGFYLYFPDRRNLPPKLRALVNHARYSSRSSQQKK
ncbi:LysR family transcriptional regulator [Steroidobacter cummioxidans]|uniref:LysR family transcriptional regulator n=1 Tax=Steroidobacter cummioxidans TaxID=1803913 RepID=UPI000E31D2B5|nr:LysR family transcriptional regulator [Steroidobacter cummioxidans]